MWKRKTANRPNRYPESAATSRVIEAYQRTTADHLRADAVIFFQRSISPINRIRLGQIGDLCNPLFKLAMMLKTRRIHGLDGKRLEIHFVRSEGLPKDTAIARGG